MKTWKEGGSLRWQGGEKQAISNRRLIRDLIVSFPSIQ